MKIIKKKKKKEKKEKKRVRKGSKFGLCEVCVKGKGATVMSVKSQIKQVITQHQCLMFELPITIPSLPILTSH